MPLPAFVFVAMLVFGAIVPTDYSPPADPAPTGMRG